MAPRVHKFSTLLGIALLAGSVGVAMAQQPSSTTSTQMGKADTTTTTRTVTATVVSVNGNKVVAKDASGKAKEYTIPEGMKFQYEGKDIGVEDLKPGMKVTAKITTTTTTTPVTVTEIRKGQVLAVSGDTVIVRSPDGVKQFSWAELQSRHVKIKNSSGQEISSFSELQPKERFTAVIVTDHPPKVVSEREAKAYVQGEQAAAPAPAPAHAAAPAPAAEPAPAAAPAKTLPKTATQVPLVGLMGALSIVAGLGLTLRRRSNNR
jgi:LPXTG-motif cell wall-anchored protein